MTKTSRYEISFPKKVKASNKLPVVVVDHQHPAGPKAGPVVVRSFVSIAAAEAALKAVGASYIVTDYRT